MEPIVPGTRCGRTVCGYKETKQCEEPISPEGTPGIVILEAKYGMAGTIVTPMQCFMQMSIL